jgi:hypothetical protein
VTTTISGVVLDATGKPVAQARVYVVKAPGPVADVAVLTGPDGRFSLAASRPGTYEIGCSTDASGSTSSPVVVGAHDAVVELRLGRRSR